MSFSYDDALKEAFVAFVMDNTCADHPWVISAVSLCTLPVLSKRLGKKNDIVLISVWLPQSVSFFSVRQPVFHLLRSNLQHVTSLSQYMLSTHLIQRLHSILLHTDNLHTLYWYF